MVSPPRLAMPRWCDSSALTITAEWHLHPDWQHPGDVVPPLWPSQLNGLSTQTGNAQVMWFLRSDHHSWMVSPPRLVTPRWCGSSALTITAEWSLHPDWQCPLGCLLVYSRVTYFYSVMGWWHLTITDIHNLDTAHIFIRIHLSHCTPYKRVPHWAPKTVARHGSGSTIHVQSPSRATHTAGGIKRHTSASVSKSARAQSEPSGGQFSIQYQQVLS